VYDIRLSEGLHPRLLDWTLWLFLGGWSCGILCIESWESSHCDRCPCFGEMFSISCLLREGYIQRNFEIKIYDMDSLIEITFTKFFYYSYMYNAWTLVPSTHHAKKWTNSGFTYTSWQLHKHLQSHCTNIASPINKTHERMHLCQVPLVKDYFTEVICKLLAHISLGATTPPQIFRKWQNP